MHLSLREALLGFRRTVRQLDGRDVEVTWDGVTQPFETRRIQNEGMPVHNFPSQRGDMLVKFIVDLPRSLDAKQKESVAQFFV